MQVTVEATWRMSRIEFNAWHGMQPHVRGMSEVLLQEADVPADVFNGTTSEDGVVTYGAVSDSQQITRPIDAVLGETVTLKDGTIVSFSSIAEALPLFFERWRGEDVVAASEGVPAPVIAEAPIVRKKK